ncbi:hypothetical protein MJ749_13210 [Paenibacillus polymyxa]|uniref:hypothetical protein n=1 Tax=Paenibacillus polymyxa TaxID=1406 RepID=UPI001C9E1479|nr:hypothetical protein [Paenibacillus polymyxa]MBY7736264.1 hypothetical protein [Paenibacillus polymyxa]UMR33658.1 hypothetical protein MJ749_13210 [Paenibacillus polymyxa]
MRKYFQIPEKVIRKLAKVKEVKNIRGKDIVDIIDAIEAAGHTDDLIHLQMEFSFTKNKGGLIIERPLSPFPKESDTPEKFLKRLVEREVIPSNFQSRIHWQPTLDDTIKICGAYRDANVVFLNIVQRKFSTRKSGWGGSIVEPYADVAPVVIHFEENIFIEYRTSQLTNIKPFILDLLGYQGEIPFEKITKVTNADANAIKATLQAIYSSEQLALPSTVGSIRLNSSKGKYDLENDAFVAELRKFLLSHNFPADDRMDVTCHMAQFKDPITGVELPITFDINIKSGGFKFSTVVTQSAIDHIVDTIVRVCYINKQQKHGEPEEVLS